MFSRIRCSVPPPGPVYTQLTPNKSQPSLHEGKTLGNYTKQNHAGGGYHTVTTSNKVTPVWPGAGVTLGIL